VLERVDDNRVLSVGHTSTIPDNNVQAADQSIKRTAEQAVEQTAEQTVDHIAVLPSQLHPTSVQEGLRRMPPAFNTESAVHTPVWEDAIEKGKLLHVR
jgi:hypothetical protein